MAGRRTKWNGWIEREDVEPNLLAKFDRFKERVGVHLKRSLPSGNGTADTLGAHRRALEDVPLTLVEQEILDRLKPEGSLARQIAAEVPRAEEREPFDARVAMLESGIDPNIDVHVNILKGDSDDPDVIAWRTEYVNTLTGEIRFVETRPERIHTVTWDEILGDRRYIRMGRI